MGQTINTLDVRDIPLARLGLPTLWRNNVALFDLNDCYRLVDYCSVAGGVAIIGIEGFVIDGEFIIPQMDFIADFSKLVGDEFCARSIEASRKFLNIVNGDTILFELQLVKVASQ